MEMRMMLCLQRNHLEDSHVPVVRRMSLIYMAKWLIIILGINYLSEIQLRD
jgi:hypothetical protein